MAKAVKATAPVLAPAPNTIRVVHPTQPQMFVEVVLASRHAGAGRKVVTLHLRYPRIVHGEMMAHRTFNRNARSSRAVPIKTLLAEIRNTPFIPWHWTGKKSGMQGVPNWQNKIVLKGAAALHVDADEPVTNEAAWLWGRDFACDLAESFDGAEYHKQVANRLVEPWMWMDLLVTSTHWANFLHLRDHEDAEPHIRDLAILVGKALELADYQILKPGEWHLPYVTDEDRQSFAFGASANLGLEPDEALRRISAARCARISYKPFDGNGSYEKELERFDLLVGNDAVHASPLEHQCSPDYVDNSGLKPRYLNPDKHGSLTGFIQFRKTVPNEAIHD